MFGDSIFKYKILMHKWTPFIQAFEIPVDSVVIQLSNDLVVFVGGWLSKKMRNNEFLLLDLKKREFEERVRGLGFVKEHEVVRVGDKLIILGGVD